MGTAKETLADRELGFQEPSVETRFTVHCFSNVIYAALAALLVAFMWMKTSKRGKGRLVKPAMDVCVEKLQEGAEAVKDLAIPVTFDDFYKKFAIKDGIMMLLGSGVLEKYEKASKAFHAALIHFQLDLSLTTSMRLVTLLRKQYEMQKYLVHKKDFIEHELEENSASAVKEEDLDLLKTYVDYAMLAYSERSEVKSSLRDLGFELLRWEPCRGLERPSFFFAFNADKKLAVISIRGTCGMDELLTDMFHTPEQSSIGQAHSGMNSAANFVVDEVLHTIKHLLVPQNYELVVTGHSLGAGIATLISIMLKYDTRIESRCVAYAPPPTLDCQAASKVDGFVTAVVHNDDIIPRFNFSIIAANLEFLLKLDEMTKDKTDQEMDKMLEDEGEVKRMAKHARITYEKKAKTLGDQNDMRIAGKIIYFVKILEEHDNDCDKASVNDGSEEKPTYYAREVSNGYPSLRRIELTDSLLADHLLESYVSCLREARVV